MVFVLFAEDQGLLPIESPSDAAESSLTGLHARLRADAARPGNTLEGRFGAWDSVVALFRALHDGASTQAEFALARISDAAVLRTLSPLVKLAGEQGSREALDVEHLGTAYEGLMGYEIGIATGPCLTLKPDDVVVDLARLAALTGEARTEHLAEAAGLVLPGKLARAVRAATTPDELGKVLSARASPRERTRIPAGAIFLQPGEARRRSGAHYTSRAVTRVLVSRTLAPLLTEAMLPEAILALRICDPAMGGGALLIEACRQLAAHLELAWERDGAAPAQIPADQRARHARRLVARSCLHGVDRNPLAVHLARLSLWLVASARDEPFTFVDQALRHGDSLLGLSEKPVAGASIDRPASDRDEDRIAARRRADLALAAFFSTSDKRARARAMVAVAAREKQDPEAPELTAMLAELRARHAPFHWSLEFPRVFSGTSPGFDAVVGNPPWVSYAGRAAQPLAAELRDFYAASSPAFHGFRNLQGLFVHRFAEMLRPGGRLGFVLPTSTSDLGGYEPTRRAHDALSVCDEELPDFGEKVFDDVFQPSMGLLSTRRASPIALESTGPWPLERRDLDPATRALVERLSALQPLPARLFGERGFQSTPADARRLAPRRVPEPPFTVAVRAGGDIAPFLRKSAEIHCDPAAFEGRFRPAAEWRTVKLLIRQTARYPMVVLSDGEAFRNSILAGFADDEWSPHLLLGYLNSTPVRFLHYMRHRDARQGMPQLKIAHLRAVPAPPKHGEATDALTRMGRDLGERNAGITPGEQDVLDALVAEILSLDDAERALVRAFGASMRR